MTKSERHVHMLCVCCIDGWSDAALIHFLVAEPARYTEWWICSKCDEKLTAHERAILLTRGVELRSIQREGGRG
jgi:hypothetical protein